MTNEEIAEEIYYYAFKHQFIDLLRNKIDHIQMIMPRTVEHSFIVQKAYDSLIKEGLIQNFIEVT
jgi:hypothetical protein